MARAAEDLTGRVFGRLTVFSSLIEKKRKKWLCLCECGEKVIVFGYNLTGKKSTSCGCYAKEVARESRLKHGMHGTPEHRSWISMRRRCYEINHISYHKYGARGITVCERWNDFNNFYKDMGPKPSAKHSLDRINVDGNYEPLNCIWSTAAEQARNQRRTKDDYNGISQREDGKWRARIYVDGRIKNLGSFINADDAIRVRKEAEIKYWDKKSS